MFIAQFLTKAEVSGTNTKSLRAAELREILPPCQLDVNDAAEKEAAVENETEALRMARKIDENEVTLSQVRQKEKWMTR